MGDCRRRPVAPVTGASPLGLVTGLRRTRAHQLKHDGLQELVDWNMGRRGMHGYSCHRREVELWQKVLERTDGNWSCHTEKRANVAEWAARGNPSVNVIWPPVGAPP